METITDCQALHRSVFCVPKVMFCARFTHDHRGSTPRPQVDCHLPTPLPLRNVYVIGNIPVDVGANLLLESVHMFFVSCPQAFFQ
jgi:hypothetical protein